MNKALCGLCNEVEVFSCFHEIPQKMDGLGEHMHSLARTPNEWSKAISLTHTSVVNPVGL